MASARQKVRLYLVLLGTMLTLGLGVLFFENHPIDVSPAGSSIERESSTGGDHEVPNRPYNPSGLEDKTRRSPGFAAPATLAEQQPALSLKGHLVAGSGKRLSAVEFLLGANTDGLKSLGRPALGEQGLFQIPVRDAPKVGLLQIRQPEFLTWQRWLFFPDAPAELDLGEVRLSPRISLLVRVVNADGKGLSGADVFGWFISEDETRYSSVGHLGSSDEHGGLRVSPSREYDEHQLLLIAFSKADRFGSCVVRGPFSSSREGESTVVCEPCKRLDGVVRDVEGHPVGEAEVSIEALGTKIWSSTTDSTGVFEAVLPVFPGTYFSARARGFLPENLPVASLGSVTSDLQITLVRESTLRFRLLEQGRGVPIESFVVTGSFSGGTPGQQISRTVDGRGTGGSWEWVGPPGELNLAFSAEDFEAVPESRFFLDPAGLNRTETIYLKKQSPTSAILGRVVCQAQHSSESVQLRLVRLQVGRGFLPKDSSKEQAYTSVIGSQFEIGSLFPGRYRISVRSENGELYSVPAFSLAEGERKDVGALLLSPPSAIFGEVVDHLGERVPRAVVRIRSREVETPSGSGLIQIATDREGLFSISGLFAGVYELSAYPSVFSAEDQTSETTQEVNLSPGGTVKTKLEVFRTISIQGRFLADGGLKDGVISLRPLGTRERTDLSLSDARQVSLSPDGDFHFTRVIPARYRIYVGRKQSPKDNFLGDFEIHRDERNLTLFPPRNSIHGRVVFKQQGPQEQLIALLTVDSDFSMQRSVDEEGRFSFGPLPDGDYTVFVISGAKIVSEKKLSINSRWTNQEIEMIAAQ